MYVSSLTFTGSLHIHIPFVHGMVEGPIAKPSILHSWSDYLLSSLLAKNDLPVLWGPAMATIANLNREL